MDYYGREFKKDIREIDKSTLDFLLQYDYPGNIRELKNMIERLFVLSKGNMLKFDGETKTNKEIQLFNKDSELETFNEARRRFEKEYISLALKNNNNNVTKTAEVIQLSKRQLFNKIKEYDIKYV
ncbi:MAG: helix-turn-helix domain-containing protein [Desulfovibrionales bacterium]